MSAPMMVARHGFDALFQRTKVGYALVRPSRQKNHAFLPLWECVQVALVARRFRMSIRHNGFCIVIHLGQVAQVDRV
jgi:hypothetical protein